MLYEAFLGLKYGITQFFLINYIFSLSLSSEKCKSIKLEKYCYFILIGFFVASQKETDVDLLVKLI